MFSQEMETYQGTKKHQFLLDFFKTTNHVIAQNEIDHGTKTWGSWCHQIGMHEVHSSKQGTLREIWGDCC